MKSYVRIFVVFLCLLLLCACGYEQQPDDTSEFSTAASVLDTEKLTTNSQIDIPLEESSFFEIHFLDVGQADASLVLCDDKAMLIDGGNAEDSDLIYAYLKAHDIQHIDYMICTHPHEDHVGGLSGALNYATVGTAYCSMTEYDSKTFQSFKNYLEKQGKGIQVPRFGEVFSLGSATVTVIAPVHNYSDINNMSIVLRIQYGDTAFLLAGDAEIDSEQDILDSGTVLQSTLLKVGHHGSDTSTSYRWLREIAPSYAVISVGKNNSYGHPAEQTLSRLQDAEVELYRTDLQGHIICSSDGTSLTFSVERNLNIDTYATENLATTEASNTASEIHYVLNTSTKKFHYSHCSSVKQMAAENRKDVTLTRDEVIAMGYSPCGRCDP